MYEKSDVRKRALLLKKIRERKLKEKGERPNENLQKALVVGFIILIIVGAYYFSKIL